MPARQFRFSIRLGVVAIIVLASGLAVSVAIGVQFYFTYQQALDTTKADYQRLAEQTSQHLTDVDKRANALLDTLIRFEPPENGDITRLPQQSLRLLTEILRLNPSFHAIHMSDARGRVMSLLDVSHPALTTAALDLHPDTRWRQIIQHPNTPLQLVRQFDERLNVVAQHRQGSLPMPLPWQNHAGENAARSTAPHLLPGQHIAGQTYARTSPRGGIIVALDVALNTHAMFLQQQGVNSGASLYLIDRRGSLIATDQTSPPTDDVALLPPMSLSEQEQRLVTQRNPIRVSNELDWPPVDFALSGQPAGFAIDMLAHISAMTGLQFEFINGYTWPELVTLFQQGHLDILQPVVFDPDHDYGGQYSKPFLQLPLGTASLNSDTAPTSLEPFADDTIAIGDGWTLNRFIQQHLPTQAVRASAGTRDAMRAVLAGDAVAAVDNAMVLRYHQAQHFMHELTIQPLEDSRLPEHLSQLHLMLQKGDDALLTLINRAIDMVPDGVHRQLDRRWLDPQLALQRHIATVPYPALQRGDLPQGELTAMSHDGRRYFAYDRRIDEHGTRLAAVIPQQLVTRPALQQAGVTAALTVVVVLLLIPLAGVFAHPIVAPIKRLQNESNKVKSREFHAVQPIRTAIVETEELAESLYDMAQAISDHERQQAALLDSFIELIAQAIDDKSAHTGNHCSRVPALGMMLAEAASASTEPAFADFNLDQGDKRREFRIAAWLHDCGKITTPDHIVDKGAKLDALYNRIHEIRTRFEVLWRDAEIDYLRKRLEAPEANPILQRQWHRRQHELKAQFALVARINTGAETLKDEDAEALKQIAEQTWLRHFDDRLGLSPQQSRRLNGAAEELPVREQLLADKAEHLIPHDRPPSYPAHLGIKMTPPEHQANLGELYNLLIKRGTLTAEDRFLINEHIIHTIKMLDALPFPPELAKVPRYASTHHERMDGKGYPRQLQGDELEVPDRLLALADVFEALTAADRPYKDPNTLSQALTIMGKMVANGHLDPDAYRLFLTSGAYRQFAEQFLTPAQQDVTDISPYLLDRQP